MPLTFSLRRSKVAGAACIGLAATVIWGSSQSGVRMHFPTAQTIERINVVPPLHSRPLAAPDEVFQNQWYQYDTKLPSGDCRWLEQSPAEDDYRYAVIMFEKKASVGWLSRVLPRMFPPSTIRATLYVGFGSGERGEWKRLGCVEGDGSLIQKTAYNPIGWGQDGRSIQFDCNGRRMLVPVPAE